MERVDINLFFQEYLEKIYGDKFKIGPITYHADTIGTEVLKCGFDISEKIETPKGESEYRRYHIEIQDYGEHIIKDKKKK